MKKITLIALLIIGLFAISTCYCLAQDVVKYKDKEYTVQTGTQGGKFLMIDDSTKIYLSSLERFEKPVDNGDGTATYKDVVYPISVGPKGGRFIISKSGSKIYIPKLVN